MNASPEIVNCEDALDFLDKISRLGRKQWVFRGHGDAAWNLESSLGRFLRVHRGRVRPEWWPAREYLAIRRFQKIAPMHLRHLPESDDLLTWLAHMQHYGSPTRLLDFTFSPIVALFFAARYAEPGPEEPAWCVHAVHLESVRARSYAVRKAAGGENLSPWAAPAEFRFGQAPPRQDFIGVCDARMSNPRQDAQEGLFFVPSRVDLDMRQWLGEVEALPSAAPHRSAWVRFDFPNCAERYYRTMEQLMQMGMTPIRLFPGLEGLCESFRFSWLDPADLAAIDDPLLG